MRALTPLARAFEIIVFISFLSAEIHAAFLPQAFARGGIPCLSIMAETPETALGVAA
jgi:hypothetical protein